jgi:hypothetical protein
MIALKALLFRIGLSVFGTIIYLVLYFRWFFRMARQTVVPAGSTGSVGWDLVSQAHNTIYAPAYWLLMVGLFSTGMAIVFLWPGPVVTP